MGALRQYVTFQEKYDEALYFIADYHSMTTVRDARGASRRFTRNVALDYLGAGVDPERSILFRQSDVPEVCELSWLLSTVTPMGMLERAHAYKDKHRDTGRPRTTGLFAYPVLMAADILLYASDFVPVGPGSEAAPRDDTRHGLFNQFQPRTEMAPERMEMRTKIFRSCRSPISSRVLAIVPGTDGRKMSKSYGTPFRCSRTRS